MSAVLLTPRCKLCAVEALFGGRECDYHSGEHHFRVGLPKRIRTTGGSSGHSKSWHWKPPRKVRRAKGGAR